MSGGSQLRPAAPESSASALLGTGAGLVMIATDGPALVCADGVCAPVDAAPLAAAVPVPADDELSDSVR